MGAQGTRSDPTVVNYALRAESFATWADDAANAAAADAVRSRLLKHCGSRRALILDIGCGPGRDLAAFIAAGHCAVGIEPCAEFVEQARRRGCEVLSGSFADVRAPGFAARLPAEFRRRGGVDGIFCLASLFHLPREDLPEVLRALLALLRPGGVLMSTLPCGGSSSARGADGRWATALPLAAHVALCERVGFRCLDSDDHLRLYNGSWGTVFAQRPQTSAPAAASSPLCREFAKLRMTTGADRRQASAERERVRWHGGAPGRLTDQRHLRHPDTYKR